MDSVGDSSSRIHDFLVVGSGPSGAQAAQTLVDAGQQVLMLDVGVLPPDEPDTGSSRFEDIRRESPGQSSLWLGEQFEGIHFGGIGTGSQLTPTRKYICQRVQELTPLVSQSFAAMESLAKGGLGGAWGLGCCTFSEAELVSAGLAVDEMLQAYQVVADRIGISYSENDIWPYTMSCIRTDQSAIEIDANSRSILQRYSKARVRFNQDGFFAGVPALALLTRDKGDRQANRYNDLDFYSNLGRSAYRPADTINSLMKNSRFGYQRDSLVLSFREVEGAVALCFQNTQTQKAETIHCRRLILAGNVLGTARIVLRSGENRQRRLPLLCNPYAYVPCLQWSRLGKTDPGPKTSSVQLSIFHDDDRTNRDVAMASLYSYGSLMLFRIIQQAPINVRDARLLMQYLAPAITIAGIHHPDRPSPQKYLELVRDPDSVSGDHLKANFELDKTELLKVTGRDAKFLRCLRHLGCQPIKKINPGFGASLHYAGSLPYSKAEQPDRLHPTGRLHRHSRVFVADGSGFCYLPAKGITYSLMANAHRTAVNAIK